MSIQIGNGTANLASRERIVLNSVSQSNLITLRSGQNNINIVFDPDDTNFMLGQRSNLFTLYQQSTPIVAFASNITRLYGDAHVEKMLYVTSNINVPTTYSTNVYTSNLTLLPVYGSTTPIPYLFASNQNGVLLKATSDKNFVVGGTLTTDMLTVKQTLSTYDLTATNSIKSDRIAGKTKTNMVLEFANDNTCNVYLRSGDGAQYANLYIGSLFTTKPLTFDSVSYNFITITSNANVASLSLSNNAAISQPTLNVAHMRDTDNAAQNVVDATINGDTAMVLDSYGRFMLGSRTPMGIATIQYNAYNVPPGMTTSNILYVASSSDLADCALCVTPTGNVGIGTYHPANKLHITQNTVDSASNAAIVGLYAMTMMDANMNPLPTSNLIDGFLDDARVYSVSSTGGVTSTNITTPLIQSPITSTPIDFAGSVLSNMSLIYSSHMSNSHTIVTNTMYASTLRADNLLIPNVNIYNILGYYGVFQPRMVFTGSNVTMSSETADYVAGGKLVVRAEARTDTQATSVGINVIGTQSSSVRVTTTSTSTSRPYFELVGPDTVTYISATSANASSGNQRMFYIFHKNGNTSLDNASLSQLQIFADGGSIYEKTMYIKNNTVGINIGNFTNILNNIRLQVRGGLVVQRTVEGNAPIFSAIESASGIFVGVGTINPAYQLHVVGHTYTTGNLLTLGSFGVGTTSPVQPLHVEGTAYFASRVGVETPNPQYSLDVANTAKINTLYVGSKLGVGTVSPEYPLHVVGNAYVTSLTVSGSATFMSNVQVTGNLQALNIAGTITQPSQPQIENLNTVTIATLTTTNDFTANANINATGNVTVGGTLEVTGRLYTRGGVASVSDSNIKTNLRRIEDPLSKIQELTGYTYNRTDTNTRIREAGLLAQDVQRVLPEVVQLGQSHNLLSISYGNMAALFVESIKAMQKEIEDLKSDIREMKYSMRNAK